MTVDMYATPRKMVEEISGIGLRHVGYAIPVEMLLSKCSKGGRIRSKSNSRFFGALCCRP